MGLAAAKNKRRIGTDPNNTRWSRNTDTFGQKILRAHGWQPGQFLGAKDAAHAHFHTDASASHIRVVLKEDNMGLGAKRNNGDECVGLDAFQHLLGRLNGKSEEVLESERVAREGVKLTLYADRKWGPMRFVRGGLLVGDEMRDTPKEELVKKEIAKVEVIKTEAVDIQGILATSVPPLPEASQEDVKVRKSRKRKAEEANEVKESKKEKKSKRRKTEEGAAEDSAAEQSTKKKDKKARKSKKDESHRAEENNPSKSKRERRKEGQSAAEGDTSEPQSSAEEPEAVTASKSKKSEKKSKKEKRSKDKKHVDVETGELKAKLSKKKRKRKEEDEEKPTENDTMGDSTSTDAFPTPVASGYSTPDPGASGRHLARRRFIAQKRLAFADPKALSQIFMIKS